MTASATGFESYVSDHLSRRRDPYAFRRQIKERLLHRYGKFLPASKDARILEVGPGFGEFLELLTVDLGYRNVRAVDVSPEVKQFCNGLIPDSTRTVHDTAHYLRECGEEFDCITMLHVVEHLAKADVIPTLRSALDVLALDGALLLEVPNMQNPLTGLAMRYGDFTHEVGFTDTSLEFVLRSAGFPEVLVFEAGLPGNHWARPLQRFGQIALKLVVSAIHAMYGLGRPSTSGILSPELCAVARRQRGGAVELEAVKRCEGASR
jgi:SAM-dependent methyltransferase